MHDDPALVGVDELLYCLAVLQNVSYRVRSGSVVAILDHLGEVGPYGVSEVIGVVAYPAHPGAGSEVDESAVTQNHQ